jgi:ElaB/YqjD/DUF883 family membrane-anchored ribosome-binding protein
MLQGVLLSLIADLKAIMEKIERVMTFQKSANQNMIFKYNEEHAKNLAKAKDIVSDTAQAIEDQCKDISKTDSKTDIPRSNRLRSRGF